MPTASADLPVQRGDDQLAALAAGVTALYEHPAFRRLAGDARSAGCTLLGASRTEGAATVALVRSLLADYESLAPRLASAAPGEADLLREALLGAGRTLDAFLAAWNHLPGRLQQADVDCAALRARAAALGATVVPNELPDQLALLPSEVESDPIGTLALLEGEILPALQQAAETLTLLEQARRALLARLATGGARLAALCAQHAAAAGIVAECEARLSDPAAVPLPPPTALRALAEWHQRLLATPESPGLTAWERRLAELEQQIPAAALGAQAALAERRRMRGWLGALNAKAGALGQAEAPRFAAAALEAHRLLHARPTPLPRVRTLLATCQTLLTHVR